MTLQEWHQVVCQRGTSGDMVADILRDWQQSVQSATIASHLCTLLEVIQAPNRWPQPYTLAQRHALQRIEGAVSLALNYAETYEI